MKPAGEDNKMAWRHISRALPLVLRLSAPGSVTCAALPLIDCRLSVLSSPSPRLSFAPSDQTKLEGPNTF